jgi:hypothetical protein
MTPSSDFANDASRCRITSARQEASWGWPNTLSLLREICSEGLFAM